ncbi:hypothetical protein GCM10007304_43550 [Rhodococcoides trifolii]|uniref:Uncharacterized protein n=1 Tax=Rhodococcoides trifolii TaxID=908250 RepID=A0A917LHT3_9NOCA|nr:hypothetical protein [Rhodococcus trifolii]GGG24983.1 hypothetical protein GCM10007304_43550 [Rhodococcus trifolii]
MSLTTGPVEPVSITPDARENDHRTVDFVGTCLTAVAIMCLVVHAALLMVTGTSMLVMVVPMLVLSGLCVAFTCRKGNGHRVREYTVTAGFGVAMLTAHWALMSAAPGHSNDTATDHAAMGHGSMDMAGSGGGAVEALMQVGLLFAAVQVALAVGAAVRAQRSGGE